MAAPKKKPTPKAKAKTKAKPAAKANSKATPKAKPRVSKVDYITQNGVTRPHKDGATKKVWDICDALNKRKTTSPPPRALVLEKAEAAGINKSTVSTQYARWRKFHGISGRVAA